MFRRHRVSTHHEVGDVDVVEVAEAAGMGTAAKEAMEASTLTRLRISRATLGSAIKAFQSDVGNCNIPTMFLRDISM
jgi:sulfopyruvate decarboxylase TPP-binding subunit